MSKPHQPRQPRQSRSLARRRVVRVALTIAMTAALSGLRMPIDARGVEADAPVVQAAPVRQAAPRQVAPRQAATARQAAAAPAAAKGAKASATEWLADPSQAERIRRVETSRLPTITLKGEPALALTLPEWMAALKIPGLSVAVFEKGAIVWAKTYGVKTAGAADAVTLDTLFQAGSISKPVAAMAAMHYVQAGKWTLDENINDKLVSWKLPENEFTKEQKVTLRRLLSHSAGTTVHGFPGYAVGAPVPTVPQILDGAAPANTAKVRVDFVPGTRTRYSGGGTTIAQLMMVDQLKKPFPRIMAETIIDPLGLRHSSYEQPLPPARAALTATGADRNGKPVDGRWHIYPEMAAAGLWTTASDLARIAIEMSNAVNGSSTRVLSQASAREMLTKQSESFGVGFALGPSEHQFGHNGADEGFQAYLSAFSDTGSGVAIMANSDNGSQIFQQIATAVAAEYGWDRYKAQPVSSFTALNVVTNRQGVDRTLALFQTLKADGAPGINPGTLNGIGYGLLTAGRTADALKLFTANVAAFPDDANAVDSLAEAQMQAGDKASAIENYRKTLRMNPKNERAVKMLEKLGVKWTAETKPQD